MVKKKVVIVDDDKVFLEELKTALSLSGYDPIIVEDPSLALDVVIASNPDVILLDLKMPQKTGFQLANELSHSSTMAEIPIIAMTGIFKEDQYWPLMDICGLKHYIQKPFKPLEIINLLERVIK